MSQVAIYDTLRGAPRPCSDTTEAAFSEGGRTTKPAKNLPLKVLIAYDGSECADAAIGDLRRAGLPRDVEATVVTVAEVWPRLSETTFAAADTIERGAERVRRMFPTWKVTAEHLDGSPYRRLVWKADEWRPDLIVVGLPGRNSETENSIRQEKLYAIN
jgi:hypothetical protein